MFKHLIPLLFLLVSIAISGGRSVHSHRSPVLPAAGGEAFQNYPASQSLLSQHYPTVRVALNPANGDTFAFTDYDIGWNSPTNHNVVAYAPSPALPGTRANFAIMQRNVGGARSEYFVYYDGTQYYGAPSIPPTVRPSGFGGIDVFRGGTADGIAAVASHQPSAIAFNATAGDTSFSESDIPVQPPNQLDTKVGIDNANQILYCMTTGRDRSTLSYLDYWLWKSSDYGVSWVFADSLKDQVTSLPAGSRAIESLDPDFQVTDNGDIYVFLTARASTAAGLDLALPPIGTGTTATVNRFGYLKSTNQGSSWTWTEAYLEGQHVTFDAGDTLDYGVALSNGGPENNGLAKTAGCVDNNGVVHLVMNGCALHMVDSLTVHYLFGIFYWNSQTRIWTQISRSSDTHNLLNDNRTARQYCSGAAGQPGGRSHPCIAYYPNSRDIFAVWSEPTINGSVEDTLNGKWVNQVWYNHSGNAGNTWDGATQLTPNSWHTGKYWTSIGRQLTLAGASTTTLRAHIVYLSDPENLNIISPDGGVVDMMKPYIYQTVDFALTGVNGNQQVPESFTLSQNYPNPFNPSTVITYSLPSSTDVTLKVYNIIGQEVATLINEHQAAGVHEATFLAPNLASGVYFYTLKAGAYTSSRKMMLMK